jgi:predicted negative regulator of RcsB-dependent stress response
MNRGGYIFIILVLGFVFGYQTYSNEKMFDRYDSILKESIGSKVLAESVDDTTSIQITELKDSIKGISNALLSFSKQKPSIVKKSYVKNFYIVNDTSESVTAETTNKTSLEKSIDLITNSD